MWASDQTCVSCRHKRRVHVAETDSQDVGWFPAARGSRQFVAFRSDFEVSEQTFVKVILWKVDGVVCGNPLPEFAFLIGRLDWKRPMFLLEISEKTSKAKFYKLPAASKVRQVF